MLTSSFFNLLLAVLLILIVTVFLYVSCNSKTLTVKRTSYTLGTVIQLSACGKNAEKAIDEAIARLNEIDNKLSVFKDYSEISHINMEGHDISQAVSKDTFFLLKKALEYSELLDGTFDPTIGPLVELWCIGATAEHVPQKQQIEEKLKLVNCRDIILNDSEYSVMLKRKNQSIDLGGIAKGYAADEVRDIFKRNNIKSALIDLGGNIYVLGKRNDGKLWNVGIQDPLKPRGEFIGIIKAKNKSVVTSGNYEKYFIVDGQKYHHIIDPRDGYPSKSKIISATIISQNSIDGDGLSTGVYILGIDKALKLIEDMKGIEAILITEDRRVYLTSGIKENFQFISKDYEYIKEYR